MTRYAVLPTAADDPLITIGKNGRRYPRKFDHEEAVLLRKQGWSYQRIADHLGVSQAAVARVLDPAMRVRMAAQADRNTRKKRRPCKGGCGRLVWMHQSGRSGYCMRCYGREVLATTVREGELRCCTCGEWKDDTEFPHRRAAYARRGRAPECRRCNTIERQKRRLRRAIRCSRCGGQKLHPKDSGGNPNKTTLCKKCYAEALHEERQSNHVGQAAKIVAEKYRA